MSGYGDSTTLLGIVVCGGGDEEDGVESRQQNLAPVYQEWQDGRDRNSLGQAGGSTFDGSCGPRC